MLCPTCGWDNLPGEETCSHCQQDLTLLDQPAASNRVERSLMEDPVSILGLHQPFVATPSTSIREAIALMLDHNIGALLVVDGAGMLAGIFSERDLLTKIAGVHDSHGDLRLGDFMTPRPEAVAATDTLDYVLHKMDGGGYRHLPVVEQGKPVGVVSVRDMLRHITRLCRDG